MRAWYQRLFLISTGWLLLLALADTASAQPPAGDAPAPPQGPPGAGPVPFFGGPPPGPVPDPNQINPSNAAFVEHNWALSYDPGVDYVEVPTTPSYAAVDFLWLKTRFGDKDLAYHQTGDQGTSDHYFDQRGYEMVPRINIRLMPWDELGVSGSWMRFGSFERTISFSNSDPNNVITSPSFPGVPGTVVATTTGGSATTPPTTVVQFANFVQSPAPFFFIPLLPTRGLFSGGAIPASQQFEFASNVAVGFPDQLLFRSTFEFQTADFKVDKTWEIGDVRGTIGLGAQYLNFSHSFRVDRINQGGHIGTRYDPQDADQDLTSNTFGSRFIDGPDQDYFWYGYHYQGVGPKFALEATWPPTGALQFFAKVGGAVALGGRQEKLNVFSQQVGSFDDRDTQAEINQFNGGLLTYSRTLVVQATHNTFVALPMAEAEVGASYAFTDWGVKPVLKVSFITQYYGGGGSDLNPNANIFLYGVNATAGIQF